MAAWFKDICFCSLIVLRQDDQNRGRNFTKYDDATYLIYSRYVSQHYIIFLNTIPQEKRNEKDT